VTDDEKMRWLGSVIRGVFPQYYNWALLVRDVRTFPHSPELPDPGKCLVGTNAPNAPALKQFCFYHLNCMPDSQRFEEHTEPERPN
jgi:hypothetical protein